MAEVIVLAFAAALNPTEIAAIAIMLLLPRPERLLLGYWLGAMLTGIVAGSVIVFALEGTVAEHTTRHTIGPVAWLVVAVLMLIAAIALAKGADTRVRERRRKRHAGEEKKTPRWQRTLSKGTARQTFFVGILLSFPGASYLAALDRIIHLHYSAVVTVLVLVGFNIVQNLLIEAPLLAFKIWPTQTPAAIDRAKAWSASHGRKYGSWALALLGVGLAIPSIVALLSR